jgi:hypothetical protein
MLDPAIIDNDIDQLWRTKMSSDRELSLEMIEQVSGGFQVLGIATVGAKLPPSGGSPSRQPIDPPPYLGGDYSGDSAGGGGSGGYMGDGDYLRPF